MICASIFEKVNDLIAKKFVEFVKLYIYKQAIKTSKDPSCVQIIKYKLA